MKSQVLLTAATIAVALCATSEARAQLFGNRALGSTLSRHMGPGGGTNAGSADSLGGAQRYARGSRANKFVGSDSRDRRGFVGAQSVLPAGRVQSAVAGLRRSAAPNVNLNPPQPAATRAHLYEPRLRVDFEFNRRSPEAIGSELTRQLEKSPSIHRTGPVEVSVAGQTAILRGEVVSERDRALAGALVLLEPGIADVQNDLTVKNPPPPSEDSAPDQDR